MQPDEYALWQLKVGLLNTQLARIKKGAETILTEMGCSTDPVDIYPILAGKKEPPWPKRTAERSTRRAKYAWYALLHIRKLRPKLGPKQPDAPGAAEAALTLGWLTSQLGLELLNEARATKGGRAPKRKTSRSTAQRHALLRRKAAKLSPNLSTNRKAQILARTSKLSVDRIRHIIK